MSLSIHSILELNNKKPALNRFIKFFQDGTKNYAYLNRQPSRISFMELSSQMVEVLKQFDGTKTVNEIIVTNSLDTNFFEFVSMMYRNSFLRESTEVYPESDLQTIVFFPTTTCNLRCVYCYASAGENPPIMIDLKKAEAWINYIFTQLGENIKNIRVLFHGGGEPTTAFPLMKDIWEKVKIKSKEAKLNVSLHSISNGNFNEHILNWFIQENAVTFFSMDGIKEDHDLLRPRADGKSSFEPAFNNLKKLGEAGLKTGIRCTVTNSNIGHLKELIDISEECDIKFINFERCSSFGRTRNLNDISISANDFLQSFLEIWKYAQGKGITIKGSPTISIQPGKNFYCNTYHPLNFSLTPEGFLSPCPEVSLQSDPLAEVFITGKVNDDGSVEFYDERIKNLKERTTKAISACKDCFLEYVCNCGCSVKSFRKNNNLLQVDEKECEFIKTISSIILKMVLNECEIFPEKYKIERYKYSCDNRKVYASYVAFNPFNN